MNRNKGLTLTIVINGTSNYGESLGNIASIQKAYRDGKTFGIRSKESLKNAVMRQSGMYDDLKVTVSGATQKSAGKESRLFATNNRALEGGYMNTDGTVVKRVSSIRFSDAVSCNEFVNELRFHNNLTLATAFAEQEGLSVVSDAGKVGLMPYNYEFDKSLKVYSVTIDLDMVGTDDNDKDGSPANAEERATRVNMILEAIRTLSLTVKGSMDNAEPIFVVGGIGKYKTHYFENVVKVKNSKLTVSGGDLEDKIKNGYKAGLIRSGILENEDEIIEKLNPVSVSDFFEELKEEVKDYYESIEVEDTSK